MNANHIAILLVAPENPDNIGAVARALKNMGFSDLRLIKPPKGWRTKSKKMAMSAADILKKSQVFDSLAKAVQDLSFVLGTTRRSRGGRGAFLPFPKVISDVRIQSKNEKIGIVFGCESKGLANDAVDFCDCLTTIPTAEVYPSLNLAQAVMVMLFAISSEENFLKKKTIACGRFLSKKEITTTRNHFKQALEALGYKKGGANLLPRILQTFQGLIKRNGLLEPEAQMLKGLSRRIKEKVLS